MKYALALLATTLLLVSCSKTSETVPDGVSSVAGSWELAYAGRGTTYTITATGEDTEVVATELTAAGVTSYTLKKASSSPAADPEIVGFGFLKVGDVLRVTILQSRPDRKEDGFPQGIDADSSKIDGKTDDAFNVVSNSGEALATLKKL